MAHSKKTSPIPPAPLQLDLRIVPNASLDQIVGWHGEGLKIKLRAPALEGKANAALIDFLAPILGVKPRDLSLLSGEKSRNKRLAISGLSAEALRRRIEEAAGKR